MKMWKKFIGEAKKAILETPQLKEEIDMQSLEREEVKNHSEN